MTYHYWMRKGARKAMNKDFSAWSHVIRGYKEKLEGDHYDQGLVKAICQPYRSYWCEEDYYMFAQIWTWIQLGEIIYFEIAPIHGPGGNSEKEYNNGILKSLPHPFTGDFHGAPVWVGDGNLYWSEKIIFDSLVWDLDDPTIRHRAHIECPAGRCQIEAGTTEITTTWLHLLSERWLARWPYNGDSIYLFHFPNPPTIQIPFHA